MNYMEGKMGDFYKKEFMASVLLFQTSCYQRIDQVKRTQRKAHTHGQQVINISYTTEQVFFV